MDAFVSSTLLVALGEIGDKTQLLSLALVCRFRKPWPILAGVVVATLVNHGLSVWFGDWLADAIPADWLTWILGGSFIALGLWMLIPDKDEGVDESVRFGPFLTSLILFFIAVGLLRPFLLLKRSNAFAFAPASAAPEGMPGVPATGGSKR